MKKHELSPTQLKAQFDIKGFPFDSTAELSPESGIIGQERAVRAMEFGLQIKNQNYNIYVSGVPGIGKSSIIKPMIREIAKDQPTPCDWCYVYNFKYPDRPKAISLPPGKGREFQKEMAKLIASLKEDLTKSFQLQEYQNQRTVIEEEFTKERERLSNELDALAKSQSFVIEQSPFGMMLIPLVEGKPLQQGELEKMTPDQKELLRKKEDALHQQVHIFVQRVRELREEMDRRIESLNDKVARYASGHLFSQLREKFKDNQPLQEYIEEVEQNVLESIAEFLPSQEPSAGIQGGEWHDLRQPMFRYSVNVIVDNSATQGAPLIEESNPTYNNLIGQIEKRSQFGTLYTDFTLIKAGSILQANGGYLIIHALDLLRQPFSWDAIKRICKNREIKIEDVGDLYGFLTTSTIKPEPIQINIRFILVGNPYLYFLLYALDEDFSKIFKVKADFGTQYNRQEQTPLQYGRFISKICKDEELPHFDKGAVAAVLEQSSRWIEHQKKLSLQFSSLADLIRESAYWASRSGKKLTSREDVAQAIKEKISRSNLIEETIREMITEGSILVDFDASVVGQVNGLVVHDLGDYSFGRPSRITVRTFMGTSGIVNIEREAKLSGKSHTKGILILAGYLGGRYAKDFPIPVSATIAFEQSYGEVDGDSASAAELAALLSSLSDVPIQQGIAITGSVNQKGEIQPIGGVNEKIEGFFTICKTIGLNGKQGVIIPKQNSVNLALNDEVIAAVAQGQFKIFAVSTIEEALEILTGKNPGEIQPDGTYPLGTINDAIVNQLYEMDQALKERNAETGDTGTK